MSTAGLQSNRGDGYQTLVAFDWALSVLTDPKYISLMIDSTSVHVDDVVIEKADGSLICCQCKKNQPTSRAWSFSDLSDELINAIHTLRSYPTATVKFYSRDSFGDLARLKEFSTNYPDAVSYETNLGEKQKETHDKLTQLLESHAQNLLAYDVLNRINFELTGDFGRMQEHLRERLRSVATCVDIAYDAIWKRLDYLGMRASDTATTTFEQQHRITKNDLVKLLSDAGVTLTPPLDVTKICRSFQHTSAIGRTWHRQIGHQKIEMPALQEILDGITTKQRSILLTGAQGAGKTCVMLELQDTLETRMQNGEPIVSLFIQSREFADIASARDRQAQGLSEQWVEESARLAEEKHVIILIDSLDVLSISREHEVLRYFLAQLDRLKTIENITLVAACREFDRKYDSRIKHIQWDKEVCCGNLNWDITIQPLLEQLAIDVSQIDSATRNLISNPRELAIFVELAEQNGGFNIGSSQELANRYLSIIVRDNPLLGENALKAIQHMADEMLKQRTLSIHRQKFKASDNIKRSLLSNNVLVETHGQQLTFGHQTLLDVLVVNHAISGGLTLKGFIESLSPAPFVRPSIRSFIAQLATGNRLSFRKQLRAVLLGDMPFHIQRLVAETWASGTPDDDDWLLLKDLKNVNPVIFKVIYHRASNISWHYFWLKHLVPDLQQNQKEDELMDHLGHISTWIDSDPSGVIDFWSEMLNTAWLDKQKVSEQLNFLLSYIDKKHIALIVPLLLQLFKAPKHQLSSLGRTVRRCVEQGVLNDYDFWNYIVGDIDANDVTKHGLSGNLKCQPNDFISSKTNFLAQKFKESDQLLELAIAAIEDWSLQYANFWKSQENIHCTFLHDSSHRNVRVNAGSIIHISALSVLLDAIEKGITHRAALNSDWWITNKDRLVSNREMSIRYFCILACTASPTTNLETIAKLLTDSDLLESDVAYEIFNLIGCAFFYLPHMQQDLIESKILALHADIANDPEHERWISSKKALLISGIPSHQRSQFAQDFLDTHTYCMGIINDKPRPTSGGGFVRPPFPFTVFLSVSENDLLKLLNHYKGYQDHADDFLIGGEREVGLQLKEAASRCPDRFLGILERSWHGMAHRFREYIVEGVGSYLSYCYGNLRPSNEWAALEKPDATILSKKIMALIEKYPDDFGLTKTVSAALESCSHVIKHTVDASRLIRLIQPFMGIHEEDPIQGDNVNHIQLGDCSRALFTVANHFLETDTAWPHSLEPMLYQAAAYPHPAIRALILQDLPYLQSKNTTLGWSLFDTIMRQHNSGLWQHAEKCLYYACRPNFEIVSPWLDFLKEHAISEDFETWGRISTLAGLIGKIELSQLTADLVHLNQPEAWKGATTVWSHPDNLKQYEAFCLAGLYNGLNYQNPHAIIVAKELSKLFRHASSERACLYIPIDLLQLYFDALKTSQDLARTDLFGIDQWLNVMAQEEPLYALDACTLYLDFASHAKINLHDYYDRLTQMLTALFRYAEECEESDEGRMLARVIGIQDQLLRLGVNNVNKWLQEAERP